MAISLKEMISKLPPKHQAKIKKAAIRLVKKELRRRQKNEE